MKSKILLSLTLLLALFLRTYRTSDLLGFWYDQGRDALVIWDFLFGSHKPFLIGPTTGIEGIFLGPFYYYLLAPFYWLGRGDPVFPAIFLAITNTVAIYLIYRIGRDFFTNSTGLAAALLSAVSFNFVHAHRWLANPTPLPFFAALALYSLLSLINRQSSRWWPVLGLCLGLSLQLEAASAIFFLPATALILFINRKSLIINRSAFLGFCLLGLTFLPQAVFDLRHQQILSKSVIKFLVSEKSFRPGFSQLIPQRLHFYFEVLTNKYFFTPASQILFSVLSTVLAVLTFRRLVNKSTLTLAIWIITPLLFLLFYYGNNGYVWDYYFTGIYPAVTILVAIIWTTAASRFWPAKLAFLLFVVVFLYQNLHRVALYLRNPSPYITLTSSRQSVDWVFQDAGDQPFNTDVYVPPVVPFAYDYLFLWRGSTKFGLAPAKKLVNRLYILYEPDPGHQGLLDTWLARQAGIGSIEETKTFGSITVQRRHRFKLTD